MTIPSMSKVGKTLFPLMKWSWIPILSLFWKITHKGKVYSKKIVYFLSAMKSPNIYSSFHSFMNSQNKKRCKAYYFINKYTNTNIKGAKKGKKT